MARYIAKQTGRDVSALPYNVLTSEELRKEFGQATFFTATDGNHGRGVAWAANKLGQKSVVLMPKGSTRTRLENIRKENAQATIEEVNYDECVRMANALAEKTPNGVMVQDTAWDGYEEIPSWIMQGYGTMAMEGRRTAERLRLRPSHPRVRSGRRRFPCGRGCGLLHQPLPRQSSHLRGGGSDAAACLYKGAAAGDGDPRIVDGDMQTIMAGLACGEPNTISWDILRNHATAFVSCPTG